MLAPRRGRNATRSIATAASEVASSVSGITPHHATPWSNSTHIV